MSYSVHPGNIFGRIGTELGKGLAESIPKEVERTRLSQGLQKLGEQKGLTPFQQFTGLAGVPGVAERPQLLQTGGELLRQQAYLNALQNQYQGQGGPQAGNKGYIPTQEDLNTSLKGEIPTLSTPEDTEQSYKNYIPPTEQQERIDAYENFNKNKARYGFDFDKALEERKAITRRNQEIQEAHRQQEEIATGKEAKVKAALDKEIARLGITTTGKDATYPPKAYQKFEEKVLNSLIPKKDGGEGLTEEQAIKKYSGELNQGHRNYQDLGSLSAWSPIDFNRQTNSLQKDFANRGEQQMMMDKLIEKYGVSHLYAAHKAYPINKNEIKTLNQVNPVKSLNPNLNNITYEKLKNEMGKSGSPLSVAYELEQKGYDPRPWLKYLTDHKDDLEVWQADQLNKNLNIVNLQDLWLRAWEK